MEVLLLTTDSSSPFSTIAAKEMPLVRVDRERDRTCSRCGKVLATSLALQKHQNKVFLCDKKGVRRAKRETRITSSIHRCRRCGKTFSGAAGLRYHIAKAVPCVFEQSIGHEKLPPMKRKDTITKIIKSPTPSQDLLSQPKARVSSGREQHDQREIKTLNLSKSDKTAKISLDEYLSSLNEKQRQAKQKPLVSRPIVSRDSKASTAAPKATTINRKRSAEDEMSLIGESAKRLCTESFAQLASQISSRSSSPNSRQSKLVSSKTTNATPLSSHERKADQMHGGNILTDGCCCRQCVRKWTCKMISRLKYLNDEVTSVRKLVQRDQNAKRSLQPDTSKSAPASAAPSAKIKTGSLKSTESNQPGDINKESASLLSDNEQLNDVSSKTESVTAELIEKYNRLNDQIMTNERALEDSVAYLKETSQHTETTSSELRTQLDELRVYIDVEKSKRDEAVAAVIAQRWSTKKNELRLLLENMTVKNKPSAEKAFHEECADIAGQLEEKKKLLANIREEASSTVKNGCESQYAVETTAKNFLERQRDDIFIFLIRSSPRIHLLTKVKLDETTKTM